MSLCIIGGSAGIFIPQVLYVRFEVSLCYPSALLFLCPACFGHLFILVAHLGSRQSRHIVEAHNVDKEEGRVLFMLRTYTRHSVKLGFLELF
jgi:hypothetical protein